MLKIFSKIKKDDSESKDFSAAEIASGEISAGIEEKTPAESVESDENGAEVTTSASITDQLVSDMSF